MFPPSCLPVSLTTPMGKSPFPRFRVPSRSTQALPSKTQQAHQRPAVGPVLPTPFISIFWRVPQFAGRYFLRCLTRSWNPLSTFSPAPEFTRTKQKEIKPVGQDHRCHRLRDHRAQSELILVPSLLCQPDPDVLQLLLDPLVISVSLQRPPTARTHRGVG